MRNVTLIVFDDAEQEAFSRLSPYGLSLGDDDDGRPRLGRMLSRVIRQAPGHVGGARERETEPVDEQFLKRFYAALTELYDTFAEQTTVEYWRGVGAPGGDDAVEGLALGRRRACIDIDAAREIVANAVLAVRP